MSIKYFLRKGFFLAIALLLCTCVAEAARFVDNNDGSVSDTVTGLVWQQTNDVDYQQWIQAKEYCEGLQSGGHNDWRLPDKDELFGIFDKTYYGLSGVAIDPVFNLVNHNPNSDRYYALWTGTEYPDSKFQNLQPKYIVIFGMFREDFLGINDDIVSDDHKNDVLCVRGGTLQVNDPDINRYETTEIVQAFAKLNINDEVPAAFTTEETFRQTPVKIKQPNQKPTAIFTAIKNSGQKPVTVALDASGSFDPDGTISSYSWSSTDGQNTTGRAATFTFDSGGNVTVTLTVADNEGAVDTALQLLATDIPNRRPTASFTANPFSGTASLEVMLDASGSFDPDGQISSYSWSSSDGRKATGRSASMTFDKAGTYNVILTVKDVKGATDTDETSITIMHDVTPTSVTIQFPPSDAKLTGNVLLAAEVEDESSINSVSVFVDGNVFGNMVRSDFGTWKFDLNTTGLPNGPHQLLVKSISNIGLIGEDYVEFISDNEVIPATITSPRNNDTLEGTVEVDLYLGDKSQLSSAILYVDDRPFGSRLMKEPWHFYLPTDSLDNGYHTLSVKLITHNGQIEWAQELSIETLNEQDVSDIEVSIISPEKGKMLDAQFTVEAVAVTEENVKFVNLYLDDEIPLETQEYNSYQNKFTFDVDLSDYADGEHTLSVSLETDTECIGVTEPVNILLNSSPVGDYSVEVHSVEVHSVEVHSVDGHSVDGHSVDVYSVDGHSVDGNSVDGHSVDGHSVDVYSVDGNSVDVYSVDGNSVDGNSVDGNSVDGNSVDGNSVDDHSVDDHSVDVYSVDGHSVDDNSVDGYSVKVQKESPKIYSFRVDVRSGKIPLKVSFTCLASDPNGGINRYVWDFGDNSGKRATSLRSTTHTYHDAGTYQATCTAINGNGSEITSDPINIVVHGDAIYPKIRGNRALAYCATVNDVTGQLHIPCVNAGLVDAGQTYEMNFSVVLQDDFVFELDDFSRVEVSNNSQCAAFDAFFDRLYIPCIEDGPLYQAVCQLVSADNMRIEIRDLDLLNNRGNPD